jgi:DNA-binding NarL/FixJ family response regulator
MIKVIVVDDHRLFRMGLKVAINSGHPDIQITGEAECGKELLKLLPITPVDVVLLDINLPDKHGTEIARNIRKAYPAIKILAVSGENSTDTIQSLLKVGIDGFISKQMGDIDELANAIRTVASGLEYFGQDVAKTVFDVYVAKKKTVEVTNEFTEREREIILACRDGLMCKEIATQMGISINTVNTHKKNIFQKLGINNTMEMVQYALKNGIIRVEN